jgi:hypothetical protein
MSTARLAWAALAAGLAVFPLGEGGSAHASSATDTTNPFNLTRNLTFQIVYPNFLRFRVGNAAAGSINLLTFTVPGTGVGNATPVAATGGDALGGTAVNVEGTGNHGAVTITATNNSGALGLGNGVVGGPRIGYDQIATSSSSPSLPAPALTNAGGTTAAVVPNAGLVTQRTAIWSYSYLNATIPEAGTYGTSANGGRVTYTAVMP